MTSEDGGEMPRDTIMAVEQGESSQCNSSNFFASTNLSKVPFVSKTVYWTTLGTGGSCADLLQGERMVVRECPLLWSMLLRHAMLANNCGKLAAFEMRPWGAISLERKQFDTLIAVKFPKVNLASCSLQVGVAGFLKIGYEWIIFGGFRLTRAVRVAMFSHVPSTDVSQSNGIEIVI